MRAVKPSLFRLSSEPVVGVDRSVELDSPASLGFHSGPDHMLGKHPEVGELDRFATREWPYDEIDEQKRLKVRSLWVVSELFDSS